MLALALTIAMAALTVGAPLLAAIVADRRTR